MIQLESITSLILFVYGAALTISSTIRAIKDIFEIRQLVRSSRASTTGVEPPPVAITKNETPDSKTL